ncbi:MAG: hypothetical protein R3B90_10005 [Planctomycetaceae bacterium]
MIRHLLPLFAGLCWVCASPAGSSALNTGNFAGSDHEIVAAAELARVRSARFWSSAELPGRWSTPCLIRVDSHSAGAGGKTQFVFDRGEVSGWSMTVQGPRAELLADVIPHEVDHMVRASLVRRPIPRWLDEGCAIRLESDSSQSWFRRQLEQHRHARIDASFLDAMCYPSDARSVEHLYCVGFSLVEFLLTRDTPRQLLRFQMDTRPPSQKLFAYYRLTVAELEAEWSQWCRQRQRAMPHNGTGEVPAPQLETAVAVVNGQHAPQTRPVLLVYTSTRCGPCRRFWAAWERNSEFRDALNAAFELRTMDVDREIAAGRTPAVDSVPTFDTGETRVIGFEGTDWLLVRLGVTVSTVTATPQSLPIERPGAGDTSAADIPATAEPAGTTETPLPAIDAPGANPAPTAALSDAAPQSRPATQAEFGADRGVLSAAGRAFPWVFTTLQLLGIVGGAAATGGVGGLALGAALKLVRWRWARRRAATHPTAPSTPPDAGSTSEKSSVLEGRAGTLPAPFPRELDEARELVAIRQSEGRVAVLDALQGMFFHDEAERLSHATDEAGRVLLDRLRQSVDARVDAVAPRTVRYE